MKFSQRGTHVTIKNTGVIIPWTNNFIHLSPQFLETQREVFQGIARVSRNTTVMKTA